MLAELQERDATGEIARIYAEIRRLWAVPYVSSLQRHLATRPGWLARLLEWQREAPTENPGDTDSMDYHFRRDVPVGRPLTVVVKTDVRQAQRVRLVIEAEEA